MPQFSTWRWYRIILYKHRVLFRVIYCRHHSWIYLWLERHLRTRWGSQYLNTAFLKFSFFPGEEITVKGFMKMTSMFMTSGVQVISSKGFLTTTLMMVQWLVLDMSFLHRFLTLNKQADLATPEGAKSYKWCEWMVSFHLYRLVNITYWQHTHCLNQWYNLKYLMSQGEFFLIQRRNIKRSVLNFSQNTPEHSPS